MYRFFAQEALTTEHAQSAINGCDTIEQVKQQGTANSDLRFDQLTSDVFDYPEAPTTEIRSLTGNGLSPVEADTESLTDTPTSGVGSSNQVDAASVPTYVGENYSVATGSELNHVDVESFSDQEMTTAHALEQQSQQPTESYGVIPEEENLRDETVSTSICQPEVVGTLADKADLKVHAFGEGFQTDDGSITPTTFPDNRQPETASGAMTSPQSEPEMVVGSLPLDQSPATLCEPLEATSDKRPRGVEEDELDVESSSSVRSTTGDASRTDQLPDQPVDGESSSSIPKPDDQPRCVEPSVPEHGTTVMANEEKEAAATAASSPAITSENFEDQTSPDSDLPQPVVTVAMQSLEPRVDEPVADEVDSISAADQLIDTQRQFIDGTTDSASDLRSGNAEPN